MKFLIFLLAILLGVWLWRRNRLNALKKKQQDKPDHAGSQSNANSNDALQQPSTMHACDHCGVHLPELDMVKGHTGRYCSESHRQDSGDKPI